MEERGTVGPKEDSSFFRLQENGCIGLLWGGNVVYELDPRKFLWYSEGRPWQMGRREWQVWPAGEDAGSALVDKGAGTGSQPGTLSLVSGQILARIRFGEPEGMAGEYACLKLTVRFENAGDIPLYTFAGGLSLPVCGKEKQKVTIPHMIYNDNPSADPERIVPHIGTEPGKGLIVEEHRLPIPAVNVEWKEGEAYAFLSLLSVPCVESGEDEDYWSMGALKEEGGVRITAASGVLMFNGMKDVFYGGRCTPLSYLKGYRRLEPGAWVEKTFYISWGKMEKEGRGYRNLTDLGYRILKPEIAPLISCQEMIAYKCKVLDSRFYETEDCAGYLTFGAANGFGNISGRPEFFLYGWTGQSIRLAWCDCMLGIKTGEPYRLERGMKVADFFLRHGEGAVPGLMRGYYMIETGEFRGAWNDAGASLSSRIQGEAIADCLELMGLLRDHGIAVPPEWEETVKRACVFLMKEESQTDKGLYPLAWTLEGLPEAQDINAGGMPCVLALARAGEYFGNEAYLAYACEKYRAYAACHMDTFEIPFAHATMDARCEDKEAGLYFFVTAAKLYELTEESCFAEWAHLAADWILTFVYHWDTGFRPGTACAREGFHSTGWPGVSVQNHHLDVFFPTYELYRFGKLCGDERLMELARLVSNALTQGICTREGEWGYTVIGEQGEQYYQTNYFQVRYPAILNYMEHYRGGMQVWNPSWITAQVMSSALKFHYLEGKM